MTEMEQFEILKWVESDGHKMRLNQRLELAKTIPLFKSVIDRKYNVFQDDVKPSDEAILRVLKTLVVNYFKPNKKEHMEDVLDFLDRLISQVEDI